MYTLHVASTPNGLKPVILLEELGVPYTLARLNLSAGEQKRPEYLAINPNGRIPTLQTPERAVFESGAILVHLALKHNAFYGSDEGSRITALEWLMFQMSGVGPMFGQWFHFAKAAPEKLPYAIDRYFAETTRLLGVLDRRLGEVEYLAGDYGIADMATWPWCRTLGVFGVQPGTFPNVDRWVAAIAARPAAQRAVAALGM